ncbi:hypothetical protein [Nesterenkonia pannonica]|nr:hypothetical protein [Nesterenkonia pannonica]
MRIGIPATSALFLSAALAMTACADGGEETDSDSPADQGEANEDAPLYDELPQEIRDA